MKKLGIIFALATSLCASTVLAAGDAKELKSVDWPFNGVMGKVDEVSAQRGFQVYREVCASCHGLSRIAFRNLQSIGFSEAEIKTLAAEYQVEDGPNDEGEMFQRPAKPSDRFPSPYANEQQARAVNNGAYPPDLSLIIKARPDGANYLYSLLTGYDETPHHPMDIPDGMYFNPYFPGQKLAMPKPISDGQVGYADGTEASVDQMAHDVVNFLQWAAEPEMEARKSMGLKVIFYLLIFTVFMYIAKRRIWSKIDH